MSRSNENNSDLANGRINRAKKNKKRAWIIFTAVMVMLLMAGVYALNEWVEYQRHIEYMEQVVEVDTFYEGIFIDNVAVGGMSLAEAQRELQETTNERLSAISFDLIYNDRRWIINHDDINASLNVDKVLQEAFKVAREGSLLERYNQIRDLEINNLNFYTILEYSKDMLIAQVERIAQQIDTLPQDAVIEFLPDEEEKFLITAEKYGVKLKQQELVDGLILRIDNSNFGEVELEVEDIAPMVLGEDLEKLTSKVVQFYTGFGTSSENRIHNVRFSMSKINGLRLDPGEVFSFNETVGRRTVERGFRPAPIIMPDRSLQDSPGGGVCQASTMMYNAALRANLEIIERRHHSFPVFYVPAGQDAAVVYGALDVKFKNNRETPVFFRAFYEDRKIYIEAYGQAFANDGEIIIESVITQTAVAPEPIRIRDDAKEYVQNPGEEKVHVVSRRGLRAQTEMIYLENGVEVWRKTVSTDNYRPIQGIIYYLPPLPIITVPYTPTQPAADSNTEQGAENIDSTE